MHMLLAVSSLRANNEVACGACGRRLRRPRGCGKRAATMTQLLRVYRTRFPYPRRDPHAGRTRGDGRGCRRSMDDAHVVCRVRVFGASCVRRIERPLSSMRWASWSRRPGMASARAEAGTTRSSWSGVLLSVMIPEADVPPHHYRMQPQHGPRLTRRVVLAMIKRRAVWPPQPLKRSSVFAVPRRARRGRGRMARATALAAIRGGSRRPARRRRRSRRPHRVRRLAEAQHGLTRGIRPSTLTPP